MVNGLASTGRRADFMNGEIGTGSVWRKHKDSQKESWSHIKVSPMAKARHWATTQV